MADLVRKYKINILNHGIRYSKEADYLVDAMANSDEIQLLEKNGYAVQILENLDETGKASQKEVGRGNRYTQQPKSHPSLSSPSPSPPPSSSDVSSVTLDDALTYL